MPRRRVHTIPNPTPHDLGVLGFDRTPAPLKVDGLSAWWKADGVILQSGASSPPVVDGSEVSLWQDTSIHDGHRQLLQLSGGAPVWKENIINGLPVVRGGGSDWLTTAPPGFNPSGLGFSFPSGDFTVFCLYRADVVQDFTAVWAAGRIGEFTDRVMVLEIGSVSFYSFRESDRSEVAVTWAQETGDGKTHLVCIDNNAGFVSVYGDQMAVAKAGGSVPFGAMLDPEIHAFNYVDGSIGFQGDIAELIVYSNALGLENRNMVGAYLRSRGGIS